VLFSTQSELVRFRKLVVNGVMATDIADKDLKTLRNNRWDKAFKVDPNHAPLSQQEQRDAINRKATIVIEHLIQASDVSHTMQHWHVFRKWNQALFEEMYEAYRTGRAKTNPADFWYQGEIGFFDYYIIPLAKKLKDCGVFGVSSDEYLNYAMKNREEWEARGKEVVLEMIEAVENDNVSKKELPEVMNATSLGYSIMEC
jgi:3'5'-cyclic nucleotide phosphodiesterase